MSIIFSSSLFVIALLTGCDTARTTDGSIQTSRWGKQLKGDKSSSRPCFICPASLVLYADRFDVDYNGVDAQHRGVRMPEPVVRPCLYTNKDPRGKMKTTDVQVVHGPQPGTLLDQGTIHRVVARVAYRMDGESNTTDDNSVGPRHHAYCRYTLQVMPTSTVDRRESLKLCRPSPSPDHGRVSCTSVGDDVSVTACRYTCDEGYVTPKSDRHLVHQDWDCHDNTGKNQVPRCMKYEIPVPLDSSQCSGLNLTVPDFDDVHLDVPKFQTPTTGGSAVHVICDINVVQGMSISNGSVGSSMVFRRSCIAKNNETDAQFSCHHDVRLNLDPGAGRSVMMAELQFQIGHLSSMDPSTWCDDTIVVERIMEATKTALILGNAEACRTANCSLLTATCHHQMRIHSDTNSSSTNAVLNVGWTVTASYQPFSSDDYFYEGAEVPEGEMLIEKIRAETEVLIKTDLDFSKKIHQAGGRLLEHTFQLAKLDLICPLAGYIVNVSTNNCQKCPANSYQVKGTCQPCPEGTFQDRTGQTECLSCRNRTLVASSGHYKSRCRPDHPLVAVLAKLPNRKSWQPSAIKTNGKLGNVAAALLLQPDPPISKSKYKKSQFQQSTAKSRRHYPDLYSSAKNAWSTKDKLTYKSFIANNTVDEHDPCSPNPCQAGGTCFRAARYDNNQIISSFKCSCRVGTKGVHCETPYCPVLYCLNGGTCHINAKWPSKGHHLDRDLLNCTCPPGYSGARCEHRRQHNAFTDAKIRHHHKGDAIRFDKTINKGAALMGAHCASNPCRNGGRCVDNSHAAPAPGFFTCLCPPNYQGELCEYAPCPASIGRTSCPISRTHLSARRKRHSCWMDTTTGRRQCRSPSDSNKTPT